MGDIEIYSRVEHIADLVNGGKARRFLYSPYKYIVANYIRLTRPNKLNGSIVTGNTFFDTPLKVALPAGMDLYLFGAKTHITEINLVKFLLKNLKSGNCFVDIGAHFGFYSLLASYIVGAKGKVIGIEASPSTYKIYHENIKDKENIEGYNLLCSDEEMEYEFNEFPILYSEYNTIYAEQFSNSTWIQKNSPVKAIVQGKTLDVILEERQLAPDFIKIDVEGAELEVIKGMQATLSKSGPLTISMEYANPSKNNGSYRQAADILRSTGFMAYVIQDDGDLLKIEVEDIASHLMAKSLESDNIIFKNFSH